MDVRAEVYDKPGCRLTKPLRIGEYSCHADLSCVADASNLRYLVHTEDDFEPHLDMTVGFKDYKPKNPLLYQNDLEHLQQWAIAQRENYDNDYTKVFRGAEVVCGRGTLTDIGRTPYCTRDAWRIVAVALDGIIYLHNCGAKDGNKFVIPPEKSLSAARTYWGHNFHHTMTATSEAAARAGVYGESEIVDCRETYSVLYRSDLIRPDGERIKLTYSSEIKAIDEEDRYVDFKTQSSHLNNDFWLKKAWFWWLQAHFAGIDLVYAGIRSDVGVVHKIEKVHRTQLRERAGKKCEVAMTFLATVLAEIKKRIGAYRLQISFCPKTRRVHFEMPSGDDDDVFLPEFINHRKHKFVDW